MKKQLAYLLVIGALGLLAACSSSLREPAIPLAEGKPTFVFFFTEN